MGSCLRKLGGRMRIKTRMHQYEVTGRRKPNDKYPNPKVYRMLLFSPNKVIARSRFWYYLRKQMVKLFKSMSSSRKILTQLRILAFGSVTPVDLIHRICTENTDLVHYVKPLTRCIMTWRLVIRLAKVRF